MARSHDSTLMAKTQLILGLSLVAAVCPTRSWRTTRARENGAATAESLAQAGPAEFLFAQTPPGKKRLSQEVQLTGEESWTIQPSTSSWRSYCSSPPPARSVTPTRRKTTAQTAFHAASKDLLRALPLNEAGRGALIGRIGDKETAQPFIIGARPMLLPLSRAAYPSASIRPRTTLATATMPCALKFIRPKPARRAWLPGKSAHFPASIIICFSKIPRRVSDKEGNAGDMVNFLVLGSEAAMQRLFTSAGW